MLAKNREGEKMPKIYALYGKSGTGKSHRAISIAYKYNIPLIIDDGLLIYKGKKIPGSISGKQEDNRLRAVKRAIFDNKKYARQMKARLQALDPDKVLIIGTSRNMIYKIVQNLRLKEPRLWINISEITSSKERSKAKYHRDRGRHVVPLSPVEVRKSFKVPLLDRLKLLITSKGTTEYLGEQSVVKPNFHGLGGVFIKEKALQDMVYHALIHDLNKHNMTNIKSVKVQSNYKGTHVEVQLAFDFGNPLHVRGKELREELANKMQSFTGLENLKIKVIISEIQVPENYKP